jgi:hypothetical protein
MSTEGTEPERAPNTDAQTEAKLRARMEEAREFISQKVQEIKESAGREPTTDEATARLEAAKRSHIERRFSAADLGRVSQFINLEATRPKGRFVSYRDAEGNEHTLMILSEQAFPVSGEALARILSTSGAEEQEQGPVQGAIEVDDDVVRALIHSAITEIERTAQNAQRDDEEIQRLKEETRAILRKLAA